MFLAPVFGYLGDRYNRKFIMSAGIAFWSVVTLFSSYTPKTVSELCCTSVSLGVGVAISFGAGVGIAVGAPDTSVCRSSSGCCC